MPDVITIGSALVDIFVSSPDFQLRENDGNVLVCQRFGEKLELDSLVIETGGAGTNTAVGFQRLGFRVGVVAELGMDAFSDVVVNDLVKNQVETTWLVKERKEQTGGSVILVSQEGGRTVLVHRGAASLLGVEDMPDKALASARWLHISSIGGQMPTLQHIFKRAQQSSVGVSWNPGSPELRWVAEHGLSELSLKCDVLMVNKEEWQMIAAHQTQLQRIVPEIVVTDGKQGGQVLLAGKEPQKYEAPSVNSVDDTGAGDAFATAYVGARLLERPVSTAIEWGVANSASVVQKVGAKPGLLSRTDLETM